MGEIRMATATETTRQTGRVVQIIGPAVDIEFPEGHLPSLHNAIRVVDRPQLAGPSAYRCDTTPITPPCSAMSITSWTAA